MKIMIKNLIIIGLIIGSFVFGVSSGYYKHFPFSLVKNGFNEVSNFKRGGRNLNIKYFTSKETDTLKQTGIYLTYGQSNSTNSGQFGYFVKNEVFQFLLGDTFVYEDPSLGVTGL